MDAVFVPTAESASLAYFLDAMVALRRPIMLVGGAGVGASRPHSITCIYRGISDWN